MEKQQVLLSMGIIVVLVCALLCAAVPHCEATHDCSQEDKTDFMSRVLTSECVNGLNSLEMTSLSPAPNSLELSALDFTTVCQASCGGAYSTWLKSTCGDLFASRVIETMCLFTEDTALVGPRCRYAFPDAVPDIRNLFEDVFSCSQQAVASACPELCRVAMANLIEHVGCCYQSLYNNTEYIHSLQDRGFINSTVAEAFTFLGRMPEWRMCDISVPHMCEEISMVLIADSSLGISCTGFMIMALAVLVTHITSMTIQL